MEKRRYTHMRLLETVIDELLTQGKTHKEIERELGLKGKQPVHDFLKKRKRKESKLAAGISLRPRTVSPRDTKHRKQKRIMKSNS